MPYNLWTEILGEVQDCIMDPLYSMLESIKSHRRRLSGFAVFVGLGLGVSVTMIAYWFLAGWLVSVSPLGSCL